MAAFDALFAALNQTVVASFAQPVTYWPSTGATTQGQSYPIRAILETPHVEDTIREGIALIFWIDGNDAALPCVPVKGDRIELASGTLYTIHRIEVDAMNGFACGCRKKSI